MQTLTLSELDRFIDRQTILFGTRERPGLMLTDSDNIVKSFYRRKRFSSSWIIPQARRFTTNSRKLLERDIAAPIVTDVIHCPDYPVHMVVYPRIPGRDFRQLTDDLGPEQLSILIPHLIMLHDSGVYFRAIHLGNLIYDGESVTLVDIADLRVQERSLTVLQRARNLAHLFNAEEDKKRFMDYGINRFMDAYVSEKHYTGYMERLFRWRIRQALNRDLRSA